MTQTSGGCLLNLSNEEFGTLNASPPRTHLAGRCARPHRRYATSAASRNAAMGVKAAQPAGGCSSGVTKVPPWSTPYAYGIRGNVSSAGNFGLAGGLALAEATSRRLSVGPFCVVRRRPILGSAFGSMPFAPLSSHSRFSAPSEKHLIMAGCRHLTSAAAVSAAHRVSLHGDDPA
jgi:hypothetical protein